MSVGFVDPTADGGTIQWYPTPGPAHFSCIDDGTRQPSVPDTADNIQAGTPNISDIFDMSSIAGAASVSSIVVWVYGSRVMDGDVGAAIYVGGGWEAVQYFGVTSAGWYSVTFNGAWTQADLDALQVKIINDGYPWPIEEIDAMYCAVTYEAGAAAAPQIIPISR